MKLLIVGCGYVGKAVLQSAPAGSTIYALTRSSDRVGELEAWGAEAVVGDWHQLTLLQLPPVDQILVSVPHRAVDEHGPQTHVVGLSNLIKALPSGWSKLVYLSTTGVYGKATGSVDETTPVSPTRIGPEIAVEAENWLVENYPAKTANVIRLAGIYGPNRVPLAQKLREGLPLDVPQEGHVNLVHVADIARMLYAVMHRDLKQSIYLFSDGNPVVRREFYQYLAMCCEVEQPQFVEPDPNSSRAARATDKQIDPSQLIAELGLEFQYPDYRSGLRQALEVD